MTRSIWWWQIAWVVEHHGIFRNFGYGDHNG